MAGFRYRPFQTQPRRLSRMLLGRGFVTNRLPVITVPGAQLATSNVALAITGTSIADADSNPQTLTVSTNQSGTISLASLTGLTGSGNGTNSLSYAGTLAAINTAIATLTYTTFLDYDGAETITIGTNDGLGGTDSKTIAVTATFEYESLGGSGRTLNPNAYSYTDAGTTLATNDGDVIYRQRDFYSAVQYVEQATLGNRPILKVGANGKRALLGDGTNDNMTEASNTVNTGSVTVFALVRCPWTTAKYRLLLDIGYAASNSISLVTTGGAFADWLTKSLFASGNGYSSGFAPRNSSPYDSLTDDTWHTVICVLSASRAEMYLDGVLLTPTTGIVGAVPSVTGTLHSIGNSTTGDYSNAWIAPHGYCDVAISSAKVAKLHTKLLSDVLT